jgi:hypothetical protein
MTKTRKLLNVHNTYYTVAGVDPAAIERANDSIVHPFMVPLIEALQHKRPHWEFEATGFGTRGVGEYSNNVLHDTFYIYDNGDKLGTIERDYYRDANTYAAGNHRINAKRQVGMRKKSKHLKVITAEILKEFYPLTIDELAAEKYKKAHSAMQQATYKDRRASIQNTEKLYEPMLAYLTSGDRWAEFEAAHDTPGVMQAKVAYHALAESARVASDLTREPHTVLIERPRDIVTKRSDEPAQSTSLYALSDDMKTSLALLKMTEVNTIIGGVGVRTDEDTFYILDKRVDVRPEEG